MATAMRAEVAIGEYTVAELAERLGGSVEGCPELVVRGVNGLDEAGRDEITFIAGPRYARRWGSSRAAAAVISEGLRAEGHDPQRRALVRVPDAEIAAIRLLELFAPPPAQPDTGVHPTAWVHPSARVDPSARVGPHVSVDRRSTVGAGAVLHGGVRIYSDAEVGEGSVLHANCVVRERCRIGRRVLLHQGVSIGGDGFGFRPDPAGDGLIKVPHLGTVEIADGVEIGANSCVDRGKFGATVIGEGTKIDNLVQVGHNCRIGRGCLIAASTAIGGSVTIGDGVTIGGAVGVADQIKIGDGALVGAKSGVMRDVPAGTGVLGYPANERYRALRQWAAVRKLPDLIRELSEAPRGPE